jgi:hypothetical protein
MSGAGRASTDRRARVRGFEMRKLMFASAVVAVLTTAGLALAQVMDGTKSIQSVTGTFTATTVSIRGKTTTCKTTDGKTIVTTKASYAGTAAGNADLAGPIKLDVRSVVNTTDDVGVVTGKLRIDVASGNDTVAGFTAVYEKGKLGGLATGHAQDPHARLYANLSAGFNAATGFTDGKLGGSAGGSAVEVGKGRCEKAGTDDKKKDDKNKDDKKKDKDDDDD